MSRFPANTIIAPTAVIADDVEIGENTTIGEYTVIKEGVRIGANNQISAHVIIGESAQDRSFKLEQAGLIEIGDNNTIREFVTIHRPTAELTKLGDNNFLMVGAHMGHDVKLGNNITLANMVQLGGHVEVGDHSNIGGSAVVHQNCRIGRYVMMAGMSATNHDAIPFMSYMGVPSVAISTNRYALKRDEFDQALRSEIMRAFKIIYAKRQPREAIIERLEAELEPLAEIQEIIEFVKSSKRGIIVNRFNSGEKYHD